MATQEIEHSALTSIYRVLKPHQERVDRLLRESLKSMGRETALVEASRYALLGEAKRFRPAIVFMVAEAIDPNADVSAAALAVEYFHTASLIADDLPCMDNDDFRRGKPTLHKAYGEPVALLASYALIAAGYESLAAAGGESVRLHAALQCAAKNTGVLGATGGQFLDLTLCEPSLEQMDEMLLKKTASLFEIAFVFGWLFGGGELSQIERVKLVARDWGMAFQIVDDLDDLSQDDGRCVNLAARLGKSAAIERVQAHVRDLRDNLGHLGLVSQDLDRLIEALLGLAKI